MNEHDLRATRAWVLHPDIKSQRDRRSPVRALDEAVALAGALGELEVVGSDVIGLQRAQPGMLFGKGKVAELKAKFAAQEVELVLIDGLVSPVQQRNLEEEWGVKLLDRTALILEIFADRARTREGVLQVELAALSYQRTRLVRAWTHLERQRGGLGFVGGPGETQIEADRRAIDDAIVRLRRQLGKVVKTRSLHRASRQKVPFPVVALVGYTNAGKSTLFNRLTGAKVFAKDMLFATLDPTMRAVELPSGQNVILSDTVGFISNLPTELVASFRATLEEVLAADLICHVRDISHPDTAEQSADVKAILNQLGVPEDARMIEIWNKVDCLEPDAQDAARVQADRQVDIYAISALTGEGVPELLDAMSGLLAHEKSDADVVLAFSQARKRAWLYEQGIVTGETASEEGSTVHVRWTARQEEQFNKI
ncbi:MAG: GTPase HflX [Marinosulfonomonas sp.]|nr:GTPase HflX [Marinosulfonomonas sp.]